MEKIIVRCAGCGRKLFFLLPKGSVKGYPIIEIQCEKDRCEAINLFDYHNPDKLMITLKKD